MVYWLSVETSRLDVLVLVTEAEIARVSNFDFFLAIFPSDQPYFPTSLTVMPLESVVTNL